jgi:integrative and conjugative element protein (TIGR02256 family)
MSDLNRILKVSRKVIRMFEKYEQREGCHEAGGILLGWVAKDYVEITDATTPNMLDLRSLFSFIRAKIPAQLRIDKAWKKSDGTKIYLGEWHTHSEPNPTPSSEDRQMISKTFQETLMEIDFLYLIIVGLKGTYWCGIQTSGGLARLDNFEIS